jgi:hypothetical protein
MLRFIFLNRFEAAMTLLPRIVWVALTLFAAASFAAAPATETPPSRADIEFDRRFGDDFFDALWALRPGSAIGVGYYKYADRLIVPDDAARAQELKFVDTWRSRLHSIGLMSLSESRRADWMILDNEFAERRWAITELREWEWDPSTYNVADPFAKILLTEFAPLDERLEVFSRRLRHVPAYYAAAQRNIKQPTLEHTQLAIEQNRGALEIFGSELNKHIEASTLSERAKRQLLQRADEARAAITGYIEFLQGMLPNLERNATSFRLGQARYDKKFFYAIQTGDSARTLYERALAEKEVLLNRMDVLADQLWAKYFPSRPAPTDRLDKIGQLISKMSDLRRARRELPTRVQPLDAAHSQHPRSHSGPLHPTHLCQSFAEQDQVDLCQRRNDRGLGGVRRARHARIRLWRSHGGDLADLFEMVVAVGRQHDPRLRSARVEHERTRGKAALDARSLSIRRRSER